MAGPSVTRRRCACRCLHIVLDRPLQAAAVQLQCSPHHLTTSPRLVRAPAPARQVEKRTGFVCRHGSFSNGRSVLTLLDDSVPVS